MLYTALLPDFYQRGNMLGLTDERDSWMLRLRSIGWTPFNRIAVV